MQRPDGMNDGRFVECGHCTENLAGICGYCGGDHHGPDCPTLRGVMPFSPEELETIQERLSVTPGVVSRTEDPDDSPWLIAKLIEDYRAIQEGLRGGDSNNIAFQDAHDPATALGILQILYGTRGAEWTN